MRAAALAGRVLRAVFAAIMLVRRPRPIHSRGVALNGEVTWLEPSQTGVRWIDDAPDGPRAVVARVSRSIGLPAPLPDVIGLALRFEDHGMPADLELSSTGAGFPARFALMLHGSPSRAHLCTIAPYVGDRGPVLIAARTIAPRDLPTALPALAARLRRGSWDLRLYAATPSGRWHPFADVTLRATPGGGDSDLRFDAGRHPIPGGRFPRWLQAMRQPSYDLAHRSR